MLFQWKLGGRLPLKLRLCLVPCIEIRPMQCPHVNHASRCPEALSPSISGGVQPTSGDKGRWDSVSPGVRWCWRSRAVPSVDKSFDLITSACHSPPGAVGKRPLSLGRTPTLVGLRLGRTKTLVGLRLMC